ncbi:MAG: endolytic transglycosylase MltG [Acidobacteriota bacterium]
MTLRRVLAFLACCVIPVAAVLGGLQARSAWTSWLTTPGPSVGEWPRTFEVTPGTGALGVARLLQREGLCDEPRLFALALELQGWTGGLHAGEYEVEEPRSPLELGRLLSSGKVRLYPITIPEGLDLEEMRLLLSEDGRWTEDELTRVFADPEPILDLDPKADDLEGYLFPDTYHLSRGASAEELRDTMLARFREVAAELGLPDALAERGLDLRELVTLASLVEEETALPQERRLVASVFDNRLRRGMKMECDPTVIVALKRDGRWHGGSITRSDLRYEGAYNTYVHPGLPPGPLSAPGQAALAAALDPADSKLIFFVATGDGGHRFAETERQHRRNVRKWREWQRANGQR